jgi:hypothetical protein
VDGGTGRFGPAQDLAGDRRDPTQAHKMKRRKWISGLPSVQSK